MRPEARPSPAAGRAQVTVLTLRPGLPPSPPRSEGAICSMGFVSVLPGRGGTFELRIVVRIAFSRRKLMK